MCRALAEDYEVHASNRAHCDLADGDAIARVIRSLRPVVIVNAAAYTAVDKAESEPDLAQAINADAVAAIAREAKAAGAALLHYSTDYVFNGAAGHPYAETDRPEPLNAYGRSKLAGETAMAAILGAQHPWWILRTSWVYGLHGGNFLKTMLKLAQSKESLQVVADQIGAPTSATLIAATSAQLLRIRPASGIYHLAAAGETSWYGFARHAIAHARARGLPMRLAADALRPITSAEYPTPARRPGNSRLDCTKLERALSIRLPDWQGAVVETVDVLLENESV